MCSRKCVLTSVPAPPGWGLSHFSKLFFERPQTFLEVWDDALITISSIISRMRSGTMFNRRGWEPCWWFIDKIPVFYNGSHVSKLKLLWCCNGHLMASGITQEITPHKKNSICGVLNGYGYDGIWCHWFLACWLLWINYISILYLSEVPGTCVKYVGPRSERR